MRNIQQSLLDLASREDIAKLTLKQTAARIGEPDISLGLLQYHFDQLRKKDQLYVDRATKTQYIGSRLTEQLTDFVEIPILGAASCGPAMRLAEEMNEGYLKISRRILKNNRNLIAIRADGDSMDNAQIPTATTDMKTGIYPGDYVIVDTSPRMLPELHKKYVLSIIDGKANIKKFLRRSYDIALISESRDSESYPPIIISPEEDYMVNGIVKMVVEG
jgi:SOS-response transcriptional repressor LexA